ncbi:hypothetical protein KY285_031166 [Solanum tuberosum]|nr:hypothetical protein KY285_031166 [Solanum tuberosum]
MTCAAASSCFKFLTSLVKSLYSVNSSFYFSPLQWRIHLLLTVFCLSTEFKSVCEAVVNISLCFERPAQWIQDPIPLSLYLQNL